MKKSEKYVQQLIREADIVREQKEQNVPDDEIWIDRTIAMLMAKWKIKWNKLTEVQQRSFKEVLMQSELRKEQLPKKRMRGRRKGRLTVSKSKRIFKARLFCCAVWYYVMHQVDGRILKVEFLEYFCEYIE